MPEEAFNRDALGSDYPWLLSSDCQYPYLVIGDDLDSVLSACLWNTVSPKDWRIIGIYSHYQNIFVNNEYNSHLKNSVWIDLDIAQPNIKSLGHHIIRLRQADSWPSKRLGFNLNERRKIYHGNFKRKYPLGTIHFLMYLFQIEIPEYMFAPQLIYLADSTWINGQSHRYIENVRDWINNCIPLASLIKIFQLLDSHEFEIKMRSLFSILESLGIPPGRGQVSSRHLKLRGHQCQYDPKDISQLQRLLTLITEILDWNPPIIGNYSFDLVYEGIRKSGKISEVVHRSYNSLDEFIEAEKVISYVIPNSGKINYTVGISI